MLWLKHLKHVIYLTPFLVHCTVGEIFCDRNDVFRAWQQCESAYLSTEGNTINVKDICSNVDCIIQCRIDAIGDCAKTDRFIDQLIIYDPEKMKIYFRVACANITFVEQLNSGFRCETNDTFCSPNDIVSNITDGLTNLYVNGNYAEYRKLLCSTFERARSCVSVVLNNESCTESEASLYTDMLKVSSSVSFCDNNDIRDLYTKYGGAVNCLNPKVDSKCFRSNVMSKVSRCRTLSQRSIMDQRLPINLDDFCLSQECNIKCYEEAVGDCSKKDQFLALDPVTVRVSNRGACDKKEELKIAVAECSMRDMTCYTDFNSSLTEAEDFLQKQNYSDYKQAMCSATSRFLNCLNYRISGKCTADMTSLLKDLLTATFSYAQCGQQDHAHFTKYGGNTECITSGSGKLSLAFLFTGMMILLYLSCVQLISY